MPPTLEVTVPLPVPAFVTARVYVAGVLKVKVAVTLVAILTVITQVLVPLHAPPQPANVEPLAGVAVSVMLVPAVSVALQVLPQLIPPVLEVTVPVPVPALATVSA
jgi:hypothetical protein